MLNYHYVFIYGSGALCINTNKCLNLPVEIVWMMRTEKDFMGEVQIPDDALYGIHSVRAQNNFPDTGRFFREWFQAMGTVKRACYLTFKEFIHAARSKYAASGITGRFPDDQVVEALHTAACDVENGLYFDQFIVPAISGGAGTSINMNVNEIITNSALVKTGNKPGDYNTIDPVEHANIFQSTNDVVPTSLKLAVMKLLNQLEEEINRLRAVIEEDEKNTRNYLRIGYTQMQEAVPSSFGRLLSTYNDALSRDWWRVSKCFERIKTVNLGGSAIGSGIAVPRFFIMEAIQTLQRISGLPVTRSENMYDSTSNLDAFVEVHAVIKAHAVNLEKMVADLRLLSSDLHKPKEVEIPGKQVGSSVMPGKVNPVIPEFVISAVHKVYSNDMLLTGLCGQGCLELNAYIPVIGHAIIESLKLLIAADQTIKENLFSGIRYHSDIAYAYLIKSPSVTTALLPYIGYNSATSLAREMKEKEIDVIEANKNLGLIDPQKLNEILQPENLLKEGFSLKDIL